MYSFHILANMLGVCMSSSFQHAMQPMDVCFAGHTYIMLHGYDGKQPPEARCKAAEVLFMDIIGVNFIVATNINGKDPAVLVGLTDESAMRFAKRHIYGLTSPGGQRQLKWQQMSLSSAR